MQKNPATFMSPEERPCCKRRSEGNRWKKWDLSSNVWNLLHPFFLAGQHMTAFTPPPHSAPCEICLELSRSKLLVLQCCWVSTGLLTQCAGTQDPLDAFTCVRNDGNCSLPSAYALGFTQVSAPLPAPGVHTACQWMLRTDQLAEHECHCRLL